MVDQNMLIPNNTERIWKEFSALLRHFILKRVPNRDDAEDILQVVFLKIHQNIDQLKDDDKLRAWIYQIVRNAIIDYYRSRKPPAAGLSETFELPEQLEDEPETALDQVSDLDVCLKLMIDRLPEKYRHALVLYEFEGVSQKKIAEELGLSLPGAKSRVQRARKKLKGILFDCCQFEFDPLGNILDYQPTENCPCE